MKIISAYMFRKVKTAALTIFLGREISGYSYKLVNLAGKIKKQ